MKNKKIILFSTLALFIVMLLTGCSSNKNTSNNENNSNDMLAVLILDKGGVNDESFNQSAWKGAKEASKELGINVKYLESEKDSDYETNIETAIDMDADLIIGVGFNLTEPIEKAAQHYPDANFAVIDGSFDVTPSNVSNITFNEKQAGYLTGLIAAKTIDSNSFGFIGGFDVPAVLNFRDGFKEGILEVNPDAVLNEQFANSFTDAAKGRAIATQMYNSGIECIMTAGGGVNIGVYEVGKEVGKYAIAVDMPQSKITPGVILTSALKNVDVGVKEAIINYANGNFKGGTETVYDITNNGVSYEKTDLISKETQEFVSEQEKTLKENVAK